MSRVLFVQRKEVFMTMSFTIYQAMRFAVLLMIF